MKNLKVSNTDPGREYRVYIEPWLYWQLYLALQAVAIGWDTRRPVLQKLEDDQA